jgi:hypothetical protein
MPYFGSTIFIVSLVCLFLLSLAGAILFATAALGERLTRASHVLAERPMRSTLVGLLLGGTGFLVVALLSKGGGGAKLVAAIVAALWVSGAVTGLAVVAQKLGDRLSQPGDPLLRRVVRGAIVLELAASFPFFGWFVLFPLSIAAGLGSVAMTVLRRKPRLEPTFAAPLGHDDLRGGRYAAR